MKETLEVCTGSVDTNGNIPRNSESVGGPDSGQSERTRGMMMDSVPLVLKDVSNVNKSALKQRRGSGQMRPSDMNGGGHSTETDNGYRLADRQQMVRTNIRFMSLVIKQLKTYIDKLGQNLTEITQKILQKTSESEDLQEYATHLMQTIGDEHEKEIQKICEKINEFKVYIQHANVVVSEVVNTPEGKQTCDCNVDNMLSRLEEVERNIPECPVDRCIYILTAPAQGTDDTSPEARLGKFDKVSVPWRIEVRRIGSFRPDDVASARVVTTICPVSDEESWVIWTWGPQMHLIDKEGKVKRSITVGSKVDDVCVDFDGNLVVSCHEKRCIKILDSNYKVQKSIDVQKVPRGIKCVSPSEMVVCGVENLHHRNGDSSGILRIDPETDQVATDLLGKDELLQPWRIAVNYNGDICVSDRNKGTVSIFDRDGKPKATYSGPDMSTRHAFAPHGICCDEFGQILVVDYSNHTVHVLDPLGRFRGFLIMDTELEKLAIFMGTSSPFSIGIDTSGDLWVGNKYGFITVLRYNTEQTIH